MESWILYQGMVSEVHENSWHSVVVNTDLLYVFVTEKEEGALMHSWTDVLFTDKKVESIACIAPETNTLTDWRKTTLDIEYTND